MTNATTAKAAIAIAAAGTLAGLGATAPANASTARGFVPRPASDVRTGPQARPDTTGIKCVASYPDAIGLAPCGQIIGHSLHVSNMWMSTRNLGSRSLEIHEEVLSPKGAYSNTASMVIGPYPDGTARWYPRKFQDLAKAHSGEWDFRAWWRHSGVWYYDQVQLGVAK
jgi:hypothetical protein